MVAFFLLLPAVFGPQDRSPIRRFLTSWPMASLGLISYGLYLWHLNMINLFMDWTGFQPQHVPIWQLVLPVLGLAIALGDHQLFRRRAARLARQGPYRLVGIVTDCEVDPAR